MSHVPTPPDRISDELIATICDRLKRNQRVRRFLPGGGNIHLERKLPFLCVFRKRTDGSDPETGSLISGQSAHLIGPGDEEHQPALRALLGRVTTLLEEEFGAFLLLEVWTAESFRPEAPAFTILAPDVEDPPIACDKLADALREIPTPRGPASVALRMGESPTPPSLPPLLPPAAGRKSTVLALGLEVQPFFRDPSTGALFPRVLRDLRRDLSTALQRAFYAFTRLETTTRPANYHVLGRGAILRVVWEADAALAEVDETFEFLLAVTPYNLAEAWKDFEDSGFRKPPAYRYRPLTFDPALLKRQLYNVVLDPLEDPALADLFRDKRNELALQLTMLENRETPRFLYGSLQLHGTIDEPLRALAKGLLEGIAPAEGSEAAGSEDGEPDGGAFLDAEGFARLARAEVDTYRKETEAFDPLIEIREDVTSLMVSRGNLLIATGTRIPGPRADALLQHEVGTHMLTHFNGSRQRLRLLSCGLPAYEELQEGLAVVAEYLVGGLSRTRLRLLAARVLACALCTDGTGFLDTFRVLHGEHGFSARTAYQVTMRVYRGGGFVKDHLYLKGLARLLHYLGSGGSLEPLWVGKFGFDHVPIIEELLWRGVLKPPSLKPRYLDMDGPRQRLEPLRTGVSVLDLISKEK
jgi:uncharacterized protein (TIGR02421 family)